VNEPLWQSIWGNLTGVGGLLRVRAALALGLTGGGIGYLLANNVMPPEAYNVIWVGALAYYFGTRGSS